MSLWAIEPVAVHRVSVPGPEVFFQRGFAERVELVIHAFLLTGPAGIVLVDTGLMADHAALNADIRARKGDWSGFRPCGPPLAAILRSRAVVPHAIVLTSFGPYAAGGLEAIGAPRLLVSARGLADLRSPEEPALAHRLPATARAALLEVGAPLADMAQPLPGLCFLEAGVHHPASAALVVETEQGRVAIADPVFVGRNLLEGRALGAAEHVAGWHGLVRRLGHLCDAILPIHDPDPTPVPRSAWHPTLAA